MAVRNDFSSGEVLTAADLNDTFASKVDYATPTNAQTGTAYTFVADDAERLTTASNGSAVTLTVPPQSSVTWSDNTILRVANYGAGEVTVDGGSGVTVTNTETTLAQYTTADIVRTASDAWTLLAGGGGGKILQVVRATDSTLRETTSSSFVDVSGMSVTITPQKTDSAIIVLVSVLVQALGTDTGGQYQGAEFQITDSSNNSLSGAEEHKIQFRYMSSAALAQAQIAQTFFGYSTPATTSATTYKLRFAQLIAGQTTRARNDVVTGQIYAIEVAA